MGSSASKAAARATAGAAKRQYPTRIPPTSPSPAYNSPPPASDKGPSVHPETHASATQDDVVDRDAADPDFARSLRSIGPVTPAPTLSNSSTSNTTTGRASQSVTGPSPNYPQMFPSRTTNPALQVVDARNRLTDEAEAEFADMGRGGFAGRQFLDVVLIRQVLLLRDEQGLDPSKIEKRMELKKGVVARLGPRGVVRHVGDSEGNVDG